MSSTSNSLSSTTATSAPAATSTPASSSDNSPSPPIFVGFIGVGVLALCLLSLCVWRRVLGRHHPFFSAHDDLNVRRPHNDNHLANGRPEMFDARMGERASEGLKWEEFMPFSVMTLTDAESIRTPDAVRKAKEGKHRDKRAREKERDKQDQGSSRLQVAVLVAMPSPLHAQSHDRVGREASGSTLRNELTIGLIETPRIKEDRHSLKKNAS